MNITKKDKVLILAGKDRGKQGEVIQVLPGKSRVFVTKIGLVKRHARPTQTQPGGIREKESSVHVSNVMLVCSSCKRGMRPKIDYLSTGKRVRVCRKCGEMIDR